jgi:hypothetical protein
VAGVGPAVITLLVAVVLTGALSLLSAGCAGELPVPGQTYSTGRVSTTASTEPPGTALGTQVADVWAEAIQKLVPLLENTPPVASLEAPVSQLKEEYVQKLVALGRQIADLDDEQRQAAYARTTSILESSGQTDWFIRYKTLYEHYADQTGETSQNFAILLSTFNTLTQYAFFDLLKDQAPEEAARLGIE